MAHQGIPKVYNLLQRRLDRYPVGAPESEALYKILKILYSEEDAKVAIGMPLRFTSLSKLSKRINIKEKALKNKLTCMAEKGLVFDIERNGEKYYMLMPTVVGAFEFSLMRVREDIDQKKLSEIYHQYMLEDDIFARDAFQEETQIGRAIIYEEAIPENYLTEVLNYEKASAIIEDSSSFSVGLCYCRHKSKHLGYTCKFPLQNCMSFGRAAEYIIRSKLGKRINKSEAKDILTESKELGMVHIADNIQRNVTYICNCCGCCCGQLGAINRLGIVNAIMTSNFLAVIDEQKCSGCGTCARKCNINAITLVGTNIPGELKAKISEDICIGCGVCAMFCKKQALSMISRKQKVVVPETTIARVITMALERGKIQNLIFDADSNFWLLSLNKFFGAIQKLPLVKRKLLNQQVKSKIITIMLEKVKNLPQ